MMEVRAPFSRASKIPVWDPTEEQREVFEKWRKETIGYLVACQEGVEPYKLPGLMEQSFGKRPPFAEMGLPVWNINHFLYLMRDCLVLRKVKERDTRCGVARYKFNVSINESSVPETFKHIREMVLEQRASEIDKMLKYGVVVPFEELLGIRKHPHPPPPPLLPNPPQYSPGFNFNWNYNYQPTGQPVDLGYGYGGSSAPYMLPPPPPFWFQPPPLMSVPPPYFVNPRAEECNPFVNNVMENFVAVNTTTTAFGKNTAATAPRSLFQGVVNDKVKEKKADFSRDVKGHELNACFDSSYFKPDNKENVHAQAEGAKLHGNIVKDEDGIVAAVPSKPHSKPEELSSTSNNVTCKVEQPAEAAANQDQKQALLDSTNKAREDGKKIDFAIYHGYSLDTDSVFHYPKSSPEDKFVIRALNIKPLIQFPPYLTQNDDNFIAFLKNRGELEKFLI